MESKRLFCLSNSCWNLIVTGDRVQETWLANANCCYKARLTPMLFVHIYPLAFLLSVITGSAWGSPMDTMLLTSRTGNPNKPHFLIKYAAQIRCWAICTQNKIAITVRVHACVSVSVCVCMCVIVEEDSANKCSVKWIDELHKVKSAVNAHY